MEQLPALSSIPRVLEILVGQSRYEAVVGSGLLETLGARASKLFRGQRCALISDTTVAPIFAGGVLLGLEHAGFTARLITVPAGEKSKSLSHAGEICEQMQQAGLDRTSFVIALGGGVIGDLAGFCAAIYHRGIPCVQVPTTLLSQVDSAIGGKTGVNTSIGKNSLGVFHQPALVLADIDCLTTLPEREFRQGFAEIVKHAIIADASLLDDLEATRDPAKLQDLVVRNIQIKAKIVSSDERESSGRRALLNFGHTIGHAIERAAGYGNILHGDAISLGMVAACEISVRKAGLPEDQRGRVVAVLQRLGLSTTLPGNISREAVLAGINADKKFEHGQVRFVVSPELGQARLTSDIAVVDLENAIAHL